MKKILYFICIIGVYYSVLFSQWEQIGFNDMYMYEITSVNDTLYTGGRDIIFRSIDDGQTWDSLSTFESVYIDVICSNDNYMFVGLSRGLFELDTLPSIYRSADKGLTWDQVYETTYGVTKIEPFENEIYAISNAYLIKSSDNGNSWESISTIGYNVIALGCNDTALFVSKYDDSLYRKFKNDSTWQEISADLPNSPIWDIVTKEDTIFVNSDSIYVSINNGDSWQDSNYGLTDDINGIYIFEDYLFATSLSNEVFISKISSMNWREVSGGLSITGNASISDMDISGNYIYLTSSTGIWRRTFSEITSGIEHLESINTVKGLIINQNYPNPFNPTTTIEYTILKPGLVTISMYNTIGEKIKSYSKGMQKKGSYIVNMDFKNYPSGIYIIEITSGQYSERKSINLLK